MAESRRKIGSVISHFFKKGRTEENKEIMISRLILIIEVVLVIVSIIIAIIIAGYARRHNCESVFWDQLGDYLLVIVVVVLIDIVIALVINQLTQVKKIPFLIAFIFVWVIILGSFDGGVYAKIKSQVLKNKENTADEKNVNEETTKDNTVVRTILYDVDKDPFMEQYTLEEYYGDVIAEQNKSEIRAQILWTNLENNKPEGEPSTNYNRLREVADAEYDTYLYERKRDKSKDSVELFENRIGRLQQSLNHREEADGESETPENERPMATGYKDKGDEYLGQKRQSDAFESYEKSAEWYMRAICHAAAETNMEEVNSCMKKFVELGEEVDKLNEIAEHKKDKIGVMIQSYKCFVDILESEIRKK